MAKSQRIGAAPRFAERSGLASFINRDFRLHCAGRFLSGLALNVQSVSIGWYVYSITGSALALGLSGLASFLPSLVFAPFTGHVADTHDRRRIVAIAFGVCAFASAGLLAVAAFQVRSVAPIYACILVVGSARAFANPASQALTPNLVPASQFANAITWYSSSWSAANISGPALGGLLYILGPKFAFGCALVVFGLAAACMVCIRHSPRAGPVRERVSWAALSAGLKFIYSRQVVFGAITLDLFAVLFGGATALLPIVSKEILHSGPIGLGLLRGSPAIGAIAMGAFLAHRPISSRAGKKMLLAVAAYGLAVIAFGLSKNLILSMALLAIVGASDQISVVVRHTMVQSETPDEMRGRVSAVNSIFIGATTDLGEFESGLTAYWFGAIAAIIMGGAMTSLVAAAWATIFPKLRDRNTMVET